MLRRRHRSSAVRPQCFTALVVIGALAACADKTDADYRADVVAAMHGSLVDDLDAMIVAARNLQTAAPNRAWNATRDADSIHDMQEAWKRMRRAWEHIEGAIGALFPGVDEHLDGRYEEMLGDGDGNPFDDTGVIGMHAIERILYSTAIRPEVVSFESALSGYKEAAYPATDDEAVAFKTELVQLVIDDTTALRRMWQPAAIDIGTAYNGLAGLMSEQKEKVELAVTGEEESRYANFTLFDLRCNLEGTQKVYNLFRNWIHSKTSGRNSDTALREKFLELETVYQLTGDDALPAAPVDWRPEAPTAANLATPFGTLWKTVREQVDPHNSGSVVYEMNQIATLLDLPTFVER
jgi:iron uptake system component EfeO